MRLNEHYLNLFKQEEKKKYLDEVWNLVESSYVSLGGQHSVKSKESLLEDRYFWKLIRRNNHISAFAIYKMSHGRKLSLCGSDSTLDGKYDLFQIMEDDMRLTERGFWAEVSEAVEHIYTKKHFDYKHSKEENDINNPTKFWKRDKNNKPLPTGQELGIMIPTEQAIKILNTLGKEAEPVTEGEFADGFHYQRVIGKDDHQDIYIYEMFDWISSTRPS